jgi:hypothetical protein
MEKINIKEILEREGEVRKFVGVAPEGFVLIHEKTLEDLKDFDVWKEWKNSSLRLQDLDKKNFDSTK